MGSRHFYVLFASTRAFLKATALVQAKNIPHKVLTAPHHLVDQCGMCLLFEEALRAKVEALLPPSDPDKLYLDKDD